MLVFVNWYVYFFHKMWVIIGFQYTFPLIIFEGWNWSSTKVSMSSHTWISLSSTYLFRGPAESWQRSSFTNIFFPWTSFRDGFTARRFYELSQNICFLVLFCFSTWTTSKFGSNPRRLHPRSDFPSDSEHLHWFRDVLSSLSLYQTSLNFKLFLPLLQCFMFKFQIPLQIR